MTSFPHTEARMEELFQESRERIYTSVIEGRAETDIGSAYAMSRTALEGFTTLDWKFRGEIRNVMGKVRDYFGNLSFNRPLNFLMISDPGAGKSFLVEKLAASIEQGKGSYVGFNMAGYSTPADLREALDEVRNLKVLDKQPILFLDEFDRLHKDYSPLLPLLWDGEFGSGKGMLKLGKLVIIMAGSGHEIIETVNKAKDMNNPAEPINQDSTKLRDLLSRVNGGILQIPSINGADLKLVGVEKICLLISLLQQRFGLDLAYIPLGIAKFVASTDFTYGVRSLAHLVNMISLSALESSKIGKFEGTALAYDKLGLPLTNLADFSGSNLVYHLSNKTGSGEIVQLWNNCSQFNAFCLVNAISE